jgi:hypothetical protein
MQNALSIGTDGVGIEVRRAGRNVRHSNVEESRRRPEGEAGPDASTVTRSPWE